EGMRPPEGEGPEGESGGPPRGDAGGAPPDEGGPPPGGGHWGGGHGSHGGEHHHGPPGPMMRIPEHLKIEQSPDGLRLSDSLGVLLAEIRTSKNKNAEESVGVPRFQGKWHGDALEVTQTNGNGAEMKQTYRLE